MHHVHGVVTSQALHDAGISKDRLSRMPEYERIAHGTYAMPGARRDFWFWGAAALSIAGEDSRLTSDSALYAVGVIQQPPTPIRVVVPEGKGSRKERDFDVRRSSHMPDTVLIRHRLRLAPVAYALTDYARDVSDAALAAAISRSLARRLTTLAEITAVADDRGGYPGSRRLCRVLEDFHGEASHSKRERKLRRVLTRLGVALHPEPLDVVGGNGRVVRQADIPVLELKLDIEVDGPHHFEPEQQEKDRRNDREMAALGWLVLRFSIYEIDEDVTAVARQIVRLIEQRRAALQAG